MIYKRKINQIHNLFATKVITMSWFLMNKKTDEKKKKEEIKKQFMKAVSLESDGKLSKDQWLKVLTESGMKKSE